MTPIERQMLENQCWIMENTLSNGDGIWVETKFQLIDKTKELINPESNKEEPCCEMPPRDNEFGISKDEVKRE